MAMKKTSKATAPLRTIKMCDVFMRQLPKDDIDEEKYYFTALDGILDDLFEVATDKGWSWTQLASEAGLAYQTVVNLGERWTKRPQFRTVLLIARAVDYQIMTTQRQGRKPVLSIMREAG